MVKLERQRRLLAPLQRPPENVRWRTLSSLPQQHRPFPNSRTHRFRPKPSPPPPPDPLLGSLKACAHRPTQHGAFRATPMHPLPRCPHLPSMSRHASRPLYLTPPAPPPPSHDSEDPPPHCLARSSPRPLKVSLAHTPKVPPRAASKTMFFPHPDPPNTITRTPCAPTPPSNIAGLTKLLRLEAFRGALPSPRARGAPVGAASGEKGRGSSARMGHRARRSRP